MTKFVVYSSPEMLIKEQMPITRKINRVVLHYTAVSSPPLGDIIPHMQAIEEFHVNKRGYDSIGYHIAIHRSGVYVACRSLNKTGAHTKGHNRGSVGVVLLGTAKDLAQHEYELAMHTVKLLNTLCNMLKVYKADVVYHRQLNETQCPVTTKLFNSILRNNGYTSILEGV